MSSAEVGSYSILLAFLAAMVGILAAVGHARFGAGAFVRACRWALGITAGLLTVALTALTVAFLGNEFNMAYVAENSERALPTGYKIAAVWAGKEGSLLLWAWMMAAMSWLAAWTMRREPAGHQAATGGILSVINAAFAGLMLYGRDITEGVVRSMSPFDLAERVKHGLAAATDGMGMNPLLQHPAMIAHPPFLFAGYAGCTIPLPFCLARLSRGGWTMSGFSASGGGLCGPGRC